MKTTWLGAVDCAVRDAVNGLGLFSLGFVTLADLRSPLKWVRIVNENFHKMKFLECPLIPTGMTVNQVSKTMIGLVWSRLLTCVNGSDNMMRFVLRGRP
jgi:hypothetical protein